MCVFNYVKKNSIKTLETNIEEITKDVENNLGGRLLENTKDMIENHLKEFDANTNPSIKRIEERVTKNSI